MRALLLCLSLSLSGCGWISFQAKPSERELDIRREVPLFYDEVKRAFAARNEDALARLFDPGIAKPMTIQQIRDWAKKFFAENEQIAFHVDKLDFEDMGPGRAVVRLTYRVTTRGGKGDFGGTEIDVVERREGRWRIMSWEKEKPR